MVRAVTALQSSNPKVSPTTRASTLSFLPTASTMSGFLSPPSSPCVLAIVRFERCLQGNRKPGRLRLERTGSAIRPSSQKRSVKAHRMQQRQQVQAFESAFPPWLRHHASRRLRSRPPVAIHAVHAMRRSPPPKRGRRGPRGPAGSSTLPPRHARTADGRERSLAAPWSPPARDAEESASAPPTTHQCPPPQAIPKLLR